MGEHVCVANKYVETLLMLPSSNHGVMSIRSAFRTLNSMTNSSQNQKTTPVNENKVKQGDICFIN